MSERESLQDDLAARLPGVVFSYRAFPDGRRESRLLNDGLADLLGPRSAADVGGTLEGLRARMHPEDVAEYDRAAARARDERRSFDFEARVRADEGYRWVHAVARATALTDGSVLWHGLLLDADARRLAEEELKRFESTMRNSQRLESLGVLAGGIAHEFNNQLQTVLGNVGFVLDELGPAAPVADALRAACDAGLRAAELCRRLLDYTGQAPPITGAVEVNALVREMARLFQVSVPRDAVLALDLAPTTLFVEADTAQLRQVILNLVTNAAEALNDVGPRRNLTVRTHALSGDVGAAGYLPGPLQPGEFVAIEVEDTGSGFEPESLARAFDPFFTTREPGRGMGLAATLGILRSHHGGIRIEPAPGRGTHVRVLLPAREASAPPAAEEIAPAWLGARRALVVDDEPSVRHVCERILGADGFEVVAVDSGAAAIRAVREAARPEHADLHVAIIDLTMPRLDGHGTLEELRKLVPGLPVVLISGYDSSRLAGRALDQITSFLPKPFLPNDLVRAVRAALAASPEAGPAPGPPARSDATRSKRGDVPEAR